MSACVCMCISRIMSVSKEKCTRIHVDRGVILCEIYNIIQLLSTVLLINFVQEIQ